VVFTKKKEKKNETVCEMFTHFKELSVVRKNLGKFCESHTTAYKYVFEIKVYIYI